MAFSIDSGHELLVKAAVLTTLRPDCLGEQSSLRKSAVSRTKDDEKWKECKTILGRLAINKTCCLRNGKKTINRDARIPGETEKKRSSTGKQLAHTYFPVSYASD